MNILNEKNIFTLLELLELGAGNRSVQISTKKLGLILKKSQQSASIQLIELQKKGLIERTFYKDNKEIRSFIRITSDGMELIHEFYSRLKINIEENSNKIVLKGNIFTGLGEGAYYMSLEGYKKQFKKHLNFIPYPGTLNLRVNDNKNKILVNELKNKTGIEIEQFTYQGRTFGKVKCYRAIIDNDKCGLLLIDRTHHDSAVVEIISEKNLRKKFKKKDGDEMEIELIL